MPSVVIIHAADDALPARALAEKLRAARLTPVIEQPPGDGLRQAVREAAVTLALWSPRSTGQAALIEEVNFAKTKSKVVHARMQNAPVPDAFKSEKIIDLTGWRGEDDFPAWRDLAKWITEKAGVPPPPPPGPKGPKGFFQPGVVPGSGLAQEARARGGKPQQQRPAQTQQRAPAQAPRPQQQQQRPAPRAPAPAAPRAEQNSGGGGLPIVPIIIAAVVAALGVGGYFVWNNMQGSQSAASAWESVPRNDATALRAFLDGDPGAARAQAEAALTALEQQTYDAAGEEDSVGAFEGFLNDFPDSEHAIEARGRIAELQTLPAEEEPAAEIVPEAEIVNPDLLPPAAVEPAPEAPGGPAALTPPAPEPGAPSDGAAPTN